MLWELDGNSSAELSEDADTFLLFRLGRLEVGGVGFFREDGLPSPVLLRFSGLPSRLKYDAECSGGGIE